MSEDLVGQVLSTFFAIAILYGIKCLVDYNRNKKNNDNNEDNKKNDK